MIDRIIHNLYLGKEKCVCHQEYSAAAEWRDVERLLIRVKSGELNLIDFLKNVKLNSHEYYNEIYEVIKPLDYIIQRKAKILKIEKHE